MIIEKEALKDNLENDCSLELTFSEAELTLPAVICSFKEGNLVIIAVVRNNREFLEYNNVYPKYREWAKDCLLGLYHDEYYLIQQINNQLVDA